MAYIKEPKGVDFIIQSKPLTEEERKSISKFIQDYKAKKAVPKVKTSASKQKTLA